MVCRGGGAGWGGGGGTGPQEGGGLLLKTLHAKPTSSLATHPQRHMPMLHAHAW